MQLSKPEQHFFSHWSKLNPILRVFWFATLTVKLQEYDNFGGVLHGKVNLKSLHADNQKALGNSDCTDTGTIFSVPFG
jgi:hypothetical protein